MESSNILHKKFLDCWRFHATCFSSGERGLESRIKQIQEELFSILSLFEPENTLSEKATLPIVYRESTSDSWDVMLLEHCPLASFSPKTNLSDVFTEKVTRYVLESMMRNRQNSILRSVKYHGLANLATLPESKLLFLAASLESMFSTRRAFGANWLANSCALLFCQEQREDKRDDVNALYRTRNKIIHEGGPLPDDFDLNEQMRLVNDIIKNAIHFVLQHRNENESRAEPDIRALMNKVRLGLKP